MSVMELQEKLRILAGAAKYDVSCSSSGSSRPNTGGIGNAQPSGICHAWTADGRCVSLLKVLYTNQCSFDCAYCACRRSNEGERAAFSPDELARLTMAFYRRNYIEGLFLSSAVAISPDRTMERLIRVAEILRFREGFQGYIHMKAIPGADLALVRRFQQDGYALRDMAVLYRAHFHSIELQMLLGRADRQVGECRTRCCGWSTPTVATATPRSCTTSA